MGWSRDTTSSSVAMNIRLVGHRVTGVHLLEHLAGHQVVYRKQSQHMLVWMRGHELASHSWNRHRSQQDSASSIRCLALQRTCGLHINSCHRRLHCCHHGRRHQSHLHCCARRYIVICPALQFAAFASAHRWCGCWLCAIVAPFRRHSA